MTCHRRLQLTILLLLAAEQVFSTLAVNKNSKKPHGLKVGGILSMAGANADIYKAKNGEDLLALKVAKHNREGVLESEHQLLSLISSKTRDSEGSNFLVLLPQEYPDLLEDVNLGNHVKGSRAIVVKRYKDGDLRTLLMDLRLKFKPMPKADMLSISRSFLKGLKVLHEKAELVHGDIKPTNILLRRDERNRLVVGITDFSEACKVDEVPEFVSGTGGYAPPEFPLKTMPNVPIPAKTTAFDVFSFGCVLYQLATFHLTGDELLKQQDLCRSNFDEFAARGFGTKKFAVSQTIVDLVRRCWSEKSERPTIDEILEVLDVYEEEIPEPKRPSKLRDCFGSFFS